MPLLNSVFQALEDPPPVGAGPAAEGLATHHGEPPPSAAITPAPWAQHCSLPGWAAGLYVLYVAAALLSLAAARQPGSVATLWYANAVAVAALAFRPGRDWPWLLAALSAAVLSANLLWGDHWATALAFLPANLAEVALAAVLLQRSGRVRAPLRSARALVMLLLLGGVLPQLVGATLGALTLVGQGMTGFSGVWLPWFEGSVIGALSVLPLAWVLCQQGPGAWRRAVFNAKLAVLLPLAVGLTLLALAQLPFPFIYLSMPLLLAAMLVDLVALLLLTLVVSVTVALAVGAGVFVPPPLRHEWEQVFVYMAFAGALVPAQLLAAALAELHDSHDRLAARSLELRRAHDGLEQFVRMASHDLREPLNTLQQFGSLLETDEAARLSDHGRQYLGLMLGSTRRMRLLLDDVLAFVRQQRHGPPVLQPVALDTVLADVADALAGRLQAGGQLHCAALPTVMGNATMLVLVFQNLVANALKFMPEGRQPVVQVQALALTGAEAGWVDVSVVDNGIGIAAEDLPKLFKPFHRLHVRRLFEGNGLGLAMARQIVQAHGGDIGVCSVPGEGSSFTVRLRLAC